MTGPPSWCSPALFRERRERLAALLDSRRLDAYLFSGAADLYYLTGYHAEGWYGIVSARGMWLFVSALLAGAARDDVAGCHWVVGRRLSASVEALAERQGWRRMGFDGDQIMFRLGDILRKRGLTPHPNPLEPLRAVKTGEELALLCRAGRITARAVDHMRRHVRVGMTERALAHAIENQFFRRGGHGAAFDLIAAVGPNTAWPHHTPGDARVTSACAVLFDVGCRVGHYRSDLTRSFHFGKMPSDYRRVHVLVTEAQRAGLKAVRPGVTGGRVDAAARDVIRRAGLGRRFVHSTGHGVGLDIHEPPWIRPRSSDVLAPDMILTVEPGVYLPGRFGVRLEDTVRVVPGGRDILTRNQSEDGDNA